MTRAEIIRQRLSNQRLSGNYFENAGEAVAHFGAIQAQDYSMVLWAIALRLESPTRSVIENLINSGEIIRTHVLRPTWHLVHKKDIRWMMELSAPYVKKATQYVDKKEGLTGESFLKAWNIIEKEFEEVDNLTKENMMSCLSKQHITVSNLLATQIIIRAELEMLICNGEKKGTYALFEKRVPPGDKLSKQEAVVKLTQVYFQSRGPATLKDFAWWSGLSMSDAKTGVAEWSNSLNSFMFNEVKFYYFEPERIISDNIISVLLPCYDEYTVGYSEGRNVVLPIGPERSQTGNGIFKPIILFENEITGIWTKSKKSPFVAFQNFSDDIKMPPKNLTESIEAFNTFNRKNTGNDGLLSKEGD